MYMQKIVIVAFTLLILIGAEAQTNSNSKTKKTIDLDAPLCYQVHDPFENINRKIFVFNDTLDNTILKPMAQVYNKTVPSWGRSRIRGFFTNLLSPLTFINNLLQGDPDAAAKTFFRFVVNSTFGILGTVDFAKDFGLYSRPQNFGDTFARYGANYGAYLVLPFFGPSSVRQTAAIPFDIYLNPLQIAFDGTERLAIFGGERFTAKAEYVDLTASLEASSLDYYAQVRSIYLQYIAKKNIRCKKIQQVDYSKYDYLEE